MSAFSGRDVAVEFAIGVESATLGALTFKNLGMMRTKSFKVSWETIDTTADDSPEFTKTSLVSFKSVEFSGDGVSYDDAIFNQSELEAHIHVPGSTTQNQPKIWLRLTFPDAIFVGPFIATEWSRDASYTDAGTWSMAASSNGAITRTAV
jgi:predicted secreted protein